MFRFICIEITSVNQTDVRSWAELKAETDFIVNFIERRRKHKFLIVLCSIDNKKNTADIYYFFSPTFFLVLQVKAYTPLKWSHTNVLANRAGWSMINISNGGDQFLNFKGGQLNHGALW